MNCKTSFKTQVMPTMYVPTVFHAQTEQCFIYNFLFVSCKL